MRIVELHEDLPPEGPEVTVGDYTTTHFYMCGSAIKTTETHFEKPGMEKLVRLMDMIYELERVVMDTGESDDDTHEFAEQVYRFHWHGISNPSHRSATRPLKTQH